MTKGGGKSSFFFLYNVYSDSMLWLFDILSKFIVAEKIAAVEPIKPTACVVSTIEQKPAYDFENDVSFQKYVSPDSSLLDEQYVPPEMVDLEKVGWGNIVVQNNQGVLRREAASALADLAAEFNKQFSKPLVVVSSYRGYAYQKNLLAWYKEKYGVWRAQWFSAKPWHSEHQLGLAIDVFNATTDGSSGYWDYFAWLRMNAHTFWWTQSYQKGVEIDGYVVEQWHWRYVGTELATYLFSNKMTLSEYVRFRRIWR